MASKHSNSDPRLRSGKSEDFARGSRAKRTQTSEPGGGNIVALAFLWLGRGLALGLLAFSPWPYGMVTWTMQSWLVPWVGLILLCGLATHFLNGRLVGTTVSGSHSGKLPGASSLVLSPFSIGLTVLLGLALLQCIPLPEPLWRTISPVAGFEEEVTELGESFAVQSPERQPLQIEGLSLPTEPAATKGAPRTLSIHPLQTQASASVFAGAIAMLIGCGLLFRGQIGNLLLLSTIAISTLLITVLGLFQSVVWNGWTLLEMPTETYFATLVSRNSAPQFIAIGMGTAIGLLVAWTKSKSEIGAEKRYNVRYPAINVVARMRRRLEELLQDLDALSLVLVFSITIMLVGVIAAASRGGILAAVFAITVTLGMTLGGHKSSQLRSAGIIVLIGFVAAILLVTLDLDVEALTRMDSISAEAYQLNNGRLDVWAMAISKPAYWFLGCGLGTFHFGILPCYGGAETVWFYHAENIYVELFTELGIPGLLIGVASLAWLCWRILAVRKQGKRDELLFTASVFAVSAVALQSLVDFSLIIPAVFLPLAALVGLFISEAKSRKHNGRHLRGKANSGRIDEQDTATPTEATPSLQRRLLESPYATYICLLLLAIGLLQGYPSLLGFAEGEQLEKTVENWGRETESGVLSAMPAISLSPAKLSHPEVALQLGRLEQKVFRAKLLSSPAWPAMDTKVRVWLAAPETISAAMRGGSEGKLAGVEELLSDELELARQLAATSERMRLAAAACPLDWRASWGMLRADMGQLHVSDRSRNYARLALFGKHLPRLQQSIATSALWAGETHVGIDLLRRTLAANPNLSNTVVALVSDQLLGPDDLDQLLPESGLIRTGVAQSLMAMKNADEGVVDSILNSVTLEELRDESVSSSDWVMVAWFAQRRNDVDAAIDAYKQAAIKSPMNHVLNFERAKLLETQGRVDEAIVEMETALRRSPVNLQYKTYLEALRGDSE